MTPPVNIGIVGSSSIVGTALKALLPTSSFEVGRVELYASPDEECGQVAEFNQEPRLLQDLAEEELASVEAIFFCHLREQHVDLFRRGEKGSYLALNVSRDLAFANEGAIFNSFVENGVKNGFQLTVPHPLATLASTLLCVLKHSVQVKHVLTVGFQSVSQYGKPGIDELHDQTTNLMNFQKVPCEVFESQLAFNIHSSLSHPSLRKREELIRDQILELTQLKPSWLSFALVQTPIFFGEACLCTFQLNEDLSEDELKGLLARNDYLDLSPASQTPLEVTDRMGFAVTVRREGEKRYWAWISGDDIKFLVAYNSLLALQQRLGAST